MADVSDEEAGIPAPFAFEAHAGAARGVGGCVVDAEEDGLRVGDVADERLGYGGAGVLILHEALGWVGAGEEGEC